MSEVLNVKSALEMIGGEKELLRELLSSFATDKVFEESHLLELETPGKQKQLENALGDIKEQIGGLVNGALPFVTIASQSLTAATSLTTLVGSFKTLIPVVAASTKTFALSTAAFVKNKVATIAVAVAQKTVADRKS